MLTLPGGKRSRRDAWKSTVGGPQVPSRRMRPKCNRTRSGRSGTIYGLAWQDGGELFTPIRGASAADGATRKSFTLGEQATTRPVFLDGMIAVGTKSGRVVLIEPEGIQ